MLVRKSVVHHPASLVADHNVAVTQQAQLVAQGGLADAQQQGEVAHAQLVRQAECMENSGAGRIGEYGKRRRHPIGSYVVQDAAKQGGNVLRVEAFDLAPLGCQNN